MAGCKNKRAATELKWVSGSRVSFRGGPIAPMEKKPRFPRG